MSSAAKTTKTKEANPAAVDAWLAALPDDQRAALSTLRALIKAAEPALIETVAWGVPQYYLGTTQILGFGAFKKHVTFGPGHAAMQTVGAELAGYDAAKETIRFTPERPLPAALVTKLVRASVAAHRRELR